MTVVVLQNAKPSGSQSRNVSFYVEVGLAKAEGYRGTCSCCISLVPMQSSQGSSLNGVFSIMP